MSNFVKIYKNIIFFPQQGFAILGKYEVSSVRKNSMDEWDSNPEPIDRERDTTGKLK